MYLPNPSHEQIMTQIQFYVQLSNQFKYPSYQEWILQLSNQLLNSPIIKSSLNTQVIIGRK